MKDDNPLRTFKGIGARDVKQESAEDAVLKDLIGIHSLIMETYHEDERVTDEKNRKWKEVYEESYELMKSHLGEFSVSDLESFVFYLAGQNQPDYNLRLKGMATGCLLHILTERNEEHGKSTKIYLDGNGANFPYLFSDAMYVDEVVVNNFKGEGICSGIGRKSAGIVGLLNCEGDWSGGAMGESGKLEVVFFVKCNGSFIGKRLVSPGGTASCVIMLDCEGQYAADSIAEGGIVDELVILGNRGDNVANRGESYSLHPGTIKRFTLLYNKGLGDSSAIMSQYQRMGHMVKDERDFKYQMEHDPKYVAIIGAVGRMRIGNPQTVINEARKIRTAYQAVETGNK